ncbi:hypothetical protein SH139x_000154 [Planctomycetaceae bacterium SH139]
MNDFRRTHQVCRGGKLSLLGNEQTAAESQKEDVVQIEDDMQLVVQRSGDALILKRKK